MLLFKNIYIHTYTHTSKVLYYFQKSPYDLGVLSVLESIIGIQESVNAGILIESFILPTLQASRYGSAMRCSKPWRQNVKIKELKTVSICLLERKMILFANFFKDLFIKINQSSSMKSVCKNTNWLNSYFRVCIFFNISIIQKYFIFNSLLCFFLLLFFLFLSKEEGAKMKDVSNLSSYPSLFFYSAWWENLAGDFYHLSRLWEWQLFS